GRSPWTGGGGRVGWPSRPPGGGGGRGPRPPPAPPPPPPPARTGRPGGGGPPPPPFSPISPPPRPALATCRLPKSNHARARFGPCHGRRRGQIPQRNIVVKSTKSPLRRDFGSSR